MSAFLHLSITGEVKLGRVHGDGSNSLLSYFVIQTKVYFTKGIFIVVSYVNHFVPWWAYIV